MSISMRTAIVMAPVHAPSRFSAHAFGWDAEWVWQTPFVFRGSTCDNERGLPVRHGCGRRRPASAGVFGPPERRVG